MKELVKIIGKAKQQVIMRICDYCQGIFILTCEDFAFQNHGVRIRNSYEIQEGWICDDCKEQILKIKNL